MLKKILHCFLTLVNAVGCISLLGMVFITASDVILRFIFNSPIASAFELSEVLMGIFSPAALLYCASKGEHVSVDILYTHLPSPVQTVCNVLTQIIILVLASLLCMESYNLIFEIRETNIQTSTLAIPMWPIALWFSVCFLGYMILCVEQLFSRGTK